jgi:hypothetical protein
VHRLPADGLSIGINVITPFLLTLESLRQRFDYLPFRELLAFLNKVALDHAPVAMNVMAFTATAADACGGGGCAPGCVQEVR